MDTDEFWHPVELARALALAAQHPGAMFARAAVDTYWTSARSMGVPSEIWNAVWLVDPFRCAWHEHRDVLCEGEVGGESLASFNLARSVGAIRRLSYAERRQDSEQLELRSISGKFTAVDVNQLSDRAAPLWASGDTDDSTFGTTIVGADAVWSKLLEATSYKKECTNPPCGKGKHIHVAWADLGEEMSRVQGAVIVRRPDLVKIPGILAPANTLDFVKTFQSYFVILKRSLLPSSTTMMGAHRPAKLEEDWRFFEAIADGYSEAAREGE